MNKASVSLAVVLLVGCAAGALPATSSWSQAALAADQLLPAHHAAASVASWQQQQQHEQHDPSSASSRQLMQGQGHCPPLTRELLAARAKNNVVLVTVVDQIVFKKFGLSFIKNAQAANIGYWFVAALDPWTSVHLVTQMGVTSECFNAPLERLQYRGQVEGYKWGSHHWHQTTWNKVHVIRAVYELGFHVIHSDTDVTWFADPMPYFSKYLDGPAHALFTTDALETMNEPSDQGYESMTSPFININTGVYFIRQYPEGGEFFKVWLNLSRTDIGHDQDGLNAVTRGEGFRGDKEFPRANHVVAGTRCFAAAMHPATLISFLPVSMFGNHYTYVNGKPHEHLNHTLYEIHWVWSGSTPESKVQSIRDTKMFWDPPEYYDPPAVMSFDIWIPQAWQGFNETPFEDTEKMIKFHLYAADTQLQQAYYGFMAAMVLNRTLVMPRFHCFCAKNWYMTQSCRINGERHGTFPYVCALSHVLRVKRLITQGIRIKGPGLYHDHVSHIREYSFLENQNVPDAIKKSRLVIAPNPQAQRQPGSPLDFNAKVKQQLPDGSTQLLLPWPLTDTELVQVLGSDAAAFRTVHFTNATQILGRGFSDLDLQARWDDSVSHLTTHWCCRSPADQRDLKLSDKVQLEILPPERRARGGQEAPSGPASESDGA